MIIFTPILSWISLPADLLSTKANLEFSFYKNAIVSGIEELDGSLLPLGVLIALALGLAFRNRKIYDPSQITRAAFLMGIGLIIANTTVIKGITDKLSAKSWGSRLVNSIDTKIPAYTFKERNYGLNYYMNGKLRVAESITSVEIPSYIFVKNDKYDEFKESTKHLEVIEIESSPNPIERTKSSYGLYKIATPTIEIQ